MAVFVRHGQHPSFAGGFVGHHAGEDGRRGDEDDVGDGGVGRGRRGEVGDV